MNNLLSKINYFHKLCLASKDNLSKLLKEALKTGSRDAYLVFLDALEEQMIEVREALDNKNLEGTLKVLSKHFPDIVGHSALSFYDLFPRNHGLYARG